MPKSVLSPISSLLHQKSDLGTILKYSESIGQSIFQKFNIEMLFNRCSCPDVEAKLYNGRRLLKEDKFDHIMSLTKILCSFLVLQPDRVIP